MLKRLFNKYFDYDTKGDGRYQKKYVRKYYLKCFKKKRGGHK